MPEPAVPERPPWWDGCRGMVFARLRIFIFDAVERLSKPLAPDEELPLAEREFLDLCDLLAAKADDLRQDTSMPEKPTYQGPPDPGRFIPSDELDRLYREERRASRLVEDAIKDGASPTYRGYIEAELEEVEKRVGPAERRERQAYDEGLRKYREAYEPHKLRVRRWRAKVEEVKKQRETEAKRDEAVKSLRQRVRRAFNPKTSSALEPSDTVPFEVLPPGQRDAEHIRLYYGEVLSRRELEGFSQERLDLMLALPWSRWRKGLSGFYGYIILEFDHTDKVLLECPVYANAVYVLDSNEERLLKMNKQQLIASGEARRIFHTGDWYERVKRVMGIE